MCYHIGISPFGGLVYSCLQLHTLMVFDGWNEYVRYLNLDFGNWTDLRGTTFNG